MANFWDSPSVEPYRGFRWTITMPGIGSPFYAMKVDKPSFKIGEYSHKILNHQFNYPGRVVWEPISATVVDIPGGPSTKLMEALNKAGYPTPDQGQNPQSGTDGVSKVAATENFATSGNIVITQLKATDSSAYSDADPTHKTGNVWTLHNAWLTDVKFGSLDYSSEDAVQVTFTIRYDWATMT